MVAAVGSVVGWAVAIAALAVPGLVAAALWAPVLIAERCRALFVALPPSGRLVVSYVGVALALSVPFVVGAAATVTLVDPESGGWSSGFVTTAVYGSGLVALGWPVAAGVVAPRVGVDWDPTGYGASTWALLVGSGLWYAVVAAAPLLAIGLVFALPGGY